MTLNNDTSNNHKIAIDTKMYNDLEKRLLSHSEQLDEVRNLTKLLTNNMLDGEEFSPSEAVSHFSLINRLIAGISSDSSDIKNIYEKMKNTRQLDCNVAVFR